MPDVSKIRLDGTMYAVKDEVARSSLAQINSDIANEAADRAAADAELLNTIGSQVSIINSTISTESTNRSNADTALGNQIAALQSSVGSPLKASLKSAMTDTSKIYVYTGSESDMTTGDWYYHNGTAWVSGGVYNATAINTDKTLSVANAAADSAVTGNEFSKLKYHRAWGGKNYLDLTDVVNGYTINSTGGLSASGNDAKSTRNFLPVEPSTTYTTSVYGRTNITPAYLLVVAYYSSASESSFISRTTNVYTFTTPSNAHYIRVSSSARDYNNVIIGFWEGTQIEEGSVATTYEPYYKANDISVDGKNFTVEALQDLANAYGGKLVKATPTEVGVGYIKVDGTPYVASGFTYKAYEVKSNHQLFYYTGELLGSAGYPMFACYDSAGTFIANSSSIISTSTSTYYTNYLVSPAWDTKKIIFNGRGDFYVKTFSFDNYIDNAASKNFLGMLNIPSLKADYCYIPFYGQSLSKGSDAPYVTDNVENNVDYMVLPSDTFLHQYQLTSGNQQPAFSAMASFHDLSARYSSKDPTIITSSFGDGGRSIAQLMSSERQAYIKTAYSYSYNIDTSPSYGFFTTSLTSTKAIADRTDSTITCPAIVYLQGERDYYTDTELIALNASYPHAYACGNDKERYKTMMKWLKEDMQNACMTTYGQTEKPLFFIYQVSGKFATKHDSSISEAQREFAAENDDVILLPATYFVPNYVTTGHLSTNGYRWYGEYVGKALYQTLIQKSESRPVSYAGGYVSGTSVHIKIANAELPLVIDTYTVEQATNYGFMVWNNGTAVTISSVDIYGDEIILNTNATLTPGQTEVSYAGMEVVGSGNIHDSSKYVSKYLYLDDSNDAGTSGNLTITHSALDSEGHSIIGKHYPMQNWLSPFHVTL